MLLSIVVPVFNEAEALPLLREQLGRVCAELACDWELIVINDGSHDATSELLGLWACDEPRLRVLEFSRNFGQQAAITAGLDAAAGDCVAVLDADLQDPPELLHDLLAGYRAGYDVVSAQRRARPGDGWFKRTSARAFYALMRTTVDRRLRPEVGECRAYSRRAVEALRSLPEQHRFTRGLVAWLGLRECLIPFERGARSAGGTKFSLVMMLRLAWTAISSFSGGPLRLSLAMGLTACVAAAGYGLFVLHATFVQHSTVPGWSSLVGLQLLSTGLLLVSVGLVGDYLARVFDEVKQRPVYVVADTWNYRPVRRPRRGLVLSSTRFTPRASESTAGTPQHSLTDEEHHALFD